MTVSLGSVAKSSPEAMVPPLTPPTVSITKD